MPRLIHARRVLAALVTLLCVAPLLAQAPAEKKAPAGPFIRLQRDADKVPTALETAIVRYVPATGNGKLTVDLVSVVHIGERDYYQKLNKHFPQYDVVLYELVAPAGTTIPKGGKRNTDNLVGLLQQMMKLTLGLEHQTEIVDYTRKNFVHADMSPQEMAEAIEKRGDNALTLTLSIAADLIRQQNVLERKKGEDAHPVPDIDPLALLTDPEGSLKFKRIMAQQLAQMGGGEMALGQTLNTILVTDRNQAALTVFQKELAKGRTKIAIFYGAAHMPDFEKRLREDFGLKRDSETWLKAWDLTKQQRSPVEDLLKLLK
jgi:hypothetical protein